jgi:maleate isomerase
MKTSRIKIAAADFAPKARARIGVVLLSSDMQTERDFAAMTPPDVYIHAARVRFDNPATKENLMNTRGRIAAAAKLINPGEKLAALLYACTSASALIGDDKIRAILRRASSDAPCFTPVSAALAGLKALGAARVAILAPYTKEVSAGVARCLQAGGITIANLVYLGIADDRRIARISLKVIVRAAIETMRQTPAADALFISCTNMRAVEVIEEIEKKIKKPVITSNQAMLWAALRACGIKTAHIPGKPGRLPNAGREKI